MDARHPGLTEALAAAYFEAARVCLDRHHTPPTVVDVINSGANEAVTVAWDQTDSCTRGAWANEIDTTEAGAYACALAAVELVEGLVAVHRAETRSGADYYIAPVGALPQDLESCVRLEVSGMDQGTEAAIEYRLTEKLAQAEAGSSNLPAIASVVAFRPRRIMLEHVTAP